MEKDQAFVEMIVRELVENPDDVKIERRVDEMGVLLTLAVNPADMGKIIGKEGRTAKAIRTLLRVLGAQNNSRVNLKIDEPNGGSYVPSEGATDDAQAAADAMASAAPAVAEELPASPVDTDSFQDIRNEQDENPTSIL
ncbi:MAG: KH domain-containing protein [Patescibacteria group bacterium]|jgi:predicted RNA-binding protein YlqC (UPF0109 family)